MPVDGSSSTSAPSTCSAARPFGHQAQAQCTAIEATKHKHYDKYYRSFAPFVMTLSGAVAQASADALMRLMRAVARRDHSMLD